jgi:phage baseplate assembly protein W
MPVERISKGFKDISLSLKVNPLNSDLIVIKNETAIARSVRNLILTDNGEKFFNPNLGSGISSLLFEPITRITASSIQTRIENTIRNYEPRVELNSVDVVPNEAQNEFNVVIRYNIVGIDARPQELTVALQSVR